jgi:hypothetical protein
MRTQSEQNNDFYIVEENSNIGNWQRRINLPLVYVAVNRSVFQGCSAKCAANNFSKLAHTFPVCSPIQFLAGKK